MRKWLLGIGAGCVGLAVLAAVPGIMPARVAAAIDAPLRINAGGGQVTDSAGNEWKADQQYSSSAGWGYVDSDRIGNQVDHGVNVSGTDGHAIFSTERWGMDGYRIDLANGTYHLQLLFAETFDGITGPGQRVFDVRVQGNTVLRALDVYAEAGFGRAVTKEIRNVTVDGGRLDITFTPQVEQPMIKGIVITPDQVRATVTPTPQASPSPAPTATPTPAVAPTPASSTTGSRTISLPLRVNAGGGSFKDRQGHTWQADQTFTGINGWGYVQDPGTGPASFRNEYHGGVGHEPHSTGRQGMSSYRFQVPELPENSYYVVTLDFSGRLEGVGAYGERIFYATVGQTVPGVQSAEVIGPVDPWTAFHSIYVPSVFRVEYVRPVNGIIEVSFTAMIGQPVINGIVIEQQD